MTTTIKIGSAGSGRDYATIQAAWNALPSTLADDYIFDLYNDSEFTSGLDTTASAKTLGAYSVTIRAAAGQGFGAHANKLTNALRYNASVGVGIAVSATLGTVFKIDVSGVVFEGLQIKNSATIGGGGGVCMAGSGSSKLVTLKNCILQSAKDGLFGCIDQAYLSVVATNCLFVQVNNTGSAVESNGGSTFKGCTFVYIGSGSSNKSAYRVSWNPDTVIDCAAFGFASAFSTSSGGSYSASSDYNATDAASIGTGQGTHNVTGLAYASQFEAVGTAGAEDLRVKAGSALIGAGVSDAALTTDILGQVRGSPPGIGAAEYAVASSPPVAPTIGTTTAIGNTGATINWTDNSSDETGFKVEWSPSPYSSWTAASNSPAAANATSLVITGLSPATTYKARVAATNAGGDSAWVETASFVTTNTVRKLKLLVEAAAAGATGVSGVVWAAQVGGIAGAEIGEFSGKSFEVALEGGQAVLKVPVADFGGSSLTTSDTPVALVRNATNTTGVVPCTVIEE